MCSHYRFTSDTLVFTKASALRDKNPAEYSLVSLFVLYPNDWQQAIIHETALGDHKAHL